MKSPVVTLLVSLLLSVVCVGASASGAASVKVEEAAALVDDYYGDRGTLDKAAMLISQALAQEPRSAAAYVQAARIAIKGGNIVSEKFRPGTVDLYEALVKKALELEPTNVRALGLQAEVFFLRGDLASALQTIERGLTLAPSDSWLRLTLADYHRRTRSVPKAIEQLQFVVRQGSGPSDKNQRRAYVVAQLELMHALSVSGNARILRDIAEKLDPILHSLDAWSLGNMSDAFSEAGAFDDAITYGRRALRLMDYGVGRRHLAIALLGKAAQLQASGQSGDAHAAEARRLGADPESLLSWFRESDPEIAKLTPIVNQLLLPRRPSRAASRQGT